LGFGQTQTLIPPRDSSAQPGIQPAVFQAVMQRTAPVNSEENSNGTSAGTWMLILFITAIPIIGIIALSMLFGVGSGLMKRLHSLTHKV
jgi:hypothetical protein